MISTALQNEIKERPRSRDKFSWRDFLLSPILTWLLTDPRAMRYGFQYVFPRAPWLPWRAIGSRQLVREIMLRDEDFPIGPQLGPAMKCGHFVLGTDRGNEYREDLDFLWKSFFDVQPSDSKQRQLLRPDQYQLTPQARLPERFSRLFGDVHENVQRLIDGRKGDRIDLVADITRPNCTLALQQLFGIGPPDDEWRSLLWEIIGNLSKPIVVRTDDEFKWEIATLKVAIDEAINAAKEKKQAETVIDRMCEIRGGNLLAEDRAKDRSDIFRNICGLAIGGCHPVAKSAAHIVRTFLLEEREFKKAFEGAKEAACNQDKTLFWSYLLEALRFFPAFPVANRACPRETVIGVDFGEPTTIKAGQEIRAGLMGAMLDPAAIAFPDSFRLDRAHSDYMVFGHGMHFCFGAAFAQWMLVEMLMPLFAHGFEREKGRAGKLRFDGVFPKKYVIKLSS